MENKFFLMSKTLWGVIVMALPVVLPLFGVSFGFDETALIGDTADKVFSAVGAILALWGRFSAKTTLTATGK